MLTASTSKGIGRNLRGSKRTRKNLLWGKGLFILELSGTAGFLPLALSQVTEIRLGGNLRGFDKFSLWHAHFAEEAAPRGRTAQFN